MGWSQKGRLHKQAVHVHLLTKVFIDLNDMEPISVALAFFHVMYAFDESLDTAQDSPDFEPLLQDNSLIEEENKEDTEQTSANAWPTNNVPATISINSLRK